MPSNTDQPIRITREAMADVKKLKKLIKHPPGLTDRQTVAIALREAVELWKESKRKNGEE
ncbi:MAG: hypothetical protein ACKV2Q_36590 [Planctomycetaceae bacterium]